MICKRAVREPIPSLTSIQRHVWLCRHSKCIATAGNRLEDAIRVSHAGAEITNQAEPEGGKLHGDRSKVIKET